MSYVTVAPELIGHAAGQLERLGAELSAAHAAATPATVGILAPAADEVSTAFTALMSTHAQEFQALSLRAASFHNQFVSQLNAAAASYGQAEFTNASAMAPAGESVPASTPPSVPVFLFFVAAALLFGPAVFREIGGTLYEYFKEFIEGTLPL